MHKRAAQLVIASRHFAAPLSVGRKLLLATTVCMEEKEIQALTKVDAAHHLVLAEYSPEIGAWPISEESRSAAMCVGVGLEWMLLMTKTRQGAPPVWLLTTPTGFRPA